MLSKFICQNAKWAQIYQNPCFKEALVNKISQTSKRHRIILNEHVDEKKEIIHLKWSNESATVQDLRNNPSPT